MIELILPRIGAETDRSHGPWTYLAFTSRGKGSELQGLRIVIDCDPRSKAILMGRRHHKLVSQNENGDHFESTIVEEWAYAPDELTFLDWRVPENVVVSDGDVQIVERRLKKK